MHVAALSSILFVLAQHVSTFPVETETKVPTLDVTLSQLSNTRIKAVVKNIGHDEVTFVHLDFFGDSAPVKKVSIHQNGVPRPPDKIQIQAEFQFQVWRLHSRESSVALSFTVSVQTHSLPYPRGERSKTSSTLLPLVTYRAGAW